jgi:predicted SAM-dependent methyltransferase
MMPADHVFEHLAERSGVYTQREMIEEIQNCECFDFVDDGVTDPFDSCMMVWASARWPTPHPQHDLTELEEDAVADAILEVSARY